MDPQVDKFVTEIVDKTLTGPGFAIYSPQEIEQFKEKLNGYFSDLIFDTLLRNLNDDQMKELSEIQDLGSEDAQNKIAQFSASIPGFIFILQDRFEKASEEIGKTGRIPEPETPSQDPSQTV